MELFVFNACANMQETKAFYLSLGLSVFQSFDACVIFDSGCGFLGFIEQENIDLPKYQCLSFNLASQADVDTRYAALHEKYICTTPTKHTHFPVYSFFLQDPDGYTVEFQYLTQLVSC